MPTEANNRLLDGCGQPEIVPVVVNFSGILAMKYETENNETWSRKQ